MKLFSVLILIAIICPHQISALLLKIDSIVVSGSNPGDFPRFANSPISKNIEFTLNENHPLKNEIILQLNNNETLKKNWPFPNCIFTPINLKVYLDKEFSNFNFDAQSDIINKNSNNLNLQNMIKMATKITLSINITKSNSD